MSVWQLDPGARQLLCPCCLRWRSEPHPDRRPAGQYARHLATTSCGDSGWVDPASSYLGATCAAGAAVSYLVGILGAVTYATGRWPL